MSEETPFFIVGSGRSGTTLLRLILSGHSRIHIPPETWYIADLVRELPLTDPLTSQQAARGVEIMTSHYRWPDMEIDPEEFRHWVNGLEEPRLRDLLDLVYAYHLRLHGKQRFGDKTPNYIHLIPALDTLYAGARFIHLIRDGRDVAISTAQLGWARYYDKKEFRWPLVMQAYREYLSSPLAPKILEVRYESLVTDPELTTRRICTFLGEEFESGMLHWYSLISLVPERERVAHPKLARPLSEDAVGVWQRKLSGWECFAIEACLQHDLRWLGYRLRYSSFVWQPLLGALGFFLWIAGPLLSQAAPYMRRLRSLPTRIGNLMRLR